MKEFRRLATVIGVAAFFIVYFIISNNFASTTRSMTAKELGVSSTGSQGGLSTMDQASFEGLLEDHILQSYAADVTVTGVGDLMAYDFQLEYAKVSEGNYDFNKSLTYIKPYLTGSNICMGNLETTVSGGNYSGDTDTLTFNTPESYLTALKNAGITFVSTANEQALDMGLTGLKTTISNIEKAGLSHTGTFSEAGQTRYVVEKVGSVNMGVIAYTNVMDDGRDASEVGYVNYLKNYDDAAIADMCSKIGDMKIAGVDTIVVMIHFGDLYSQTATDAQKSLCHKLCDAGADIIFGSHPHVLEPMEVYTAHNNGSRNCLIFYSLGNFLSAQQFQPAKQNPRDLGAIVKVHMKKDKFGLSIDSFSVMPTYCDWTDDNIRVLPITYVQDNYDEFKEELDYLDDARLKAGYEGVIKTLVSGTGLTYTYDNYWYTVNVQ